MCKSGSLCDNFIEGEMSLFEKISSWMTESEADMGEETFWSDPQSLDSGICMVAVS